MSQYSNKKPSNSCFTTIFQTFICTGNLPTHPSSSPFSSSDQILEKPGKIHPFTHPPSSNLNGDSDITALKCQEVQVTSPGVIAKLMGLDSLPKYATITNNNDMLFRSKSLNSLHFLPDFNSARVASHRRARTSASFHDQGHKFLAKIDENLRNDGMQMKEFDELGFGCRKKHSKKNEVVLKGAKQEKSSRIKDNGSKKGYDECYYTTRSSKLKKSSVGGNGVISEKNCVRGKCGIPKKKLVFVDKEKFNRKNVGSTFFTSSSKKKVDHEQDMCIEVIQSHDLLLSPNPDFALGHHKEFLPHYSKGERRQIASNSRRESTPKIKITDNLPQERMPKPKQNNHKCSSRIASKHKLVKEEVEAADEFVEMLGNICKLAEDQTKDSKWVANYEVLKVQFVSELCINFSQELLDLLLDEVVNENIMLL